MDIMGNLYTYNLVYLFLYVTFCIDICSNRFLFQLLYKITVKNMTIINIFYHS